MDRSPSLRFLRAGFGMIIVALAMFAAAVATGAAGGPKILSGVFLVFMVLCAVLGLILGLVARAKGRIETEQLRAQAAAEIKTREA